MLEAGQQFSRFKILSKLGEGGMGAVYLAEDQKLGRTVALKTLQAEFFDDPDRMSRFVREAKTAAQVSHSNVMAIYDLDKLKDEKSGQEINFIVMEYIEGVSLTEYLGSGKVARKDILRIAEKVAAGLSAAHKLNIVHRDIKTDNIMVTETGDPKILDFGLAKPVEMGLGKEDVDSTNTADNNLTQEGKILGTVNYMSPEQARGDTVDNRSDIFSFGILLYKMVTGQFAFEATDRVSVLAKILEGRHAPIRQIDESLPSELERIIDKCLQKDPRDRYQSTRDLVVDLRSLRRQFESGITDSVSSISDVDMSGVKVKRIPFMRIAGSIAVLALVAFVIYQALIDDSPSIPPSVLASENGLAILGFENKTGDEELDWLQAGLPEILLTDLAQYGKVNLISRGRVLDCLDGDDDFKSSMVTHQACVEAARSLGATKVLAGTFYKVGERIRIDARLEDTQTGTIVLAEKVSGEDPFVLVDSLTQKIATSLDVQGITSDKRSVADFTSSSPEAYREYIIGMEKFDIFESESAREHFFKAIEIDSNFALPYMRIGMSYALRGRAQQSLPFFEQAKKFEDGLPPKERSLLDVYLDIWLRQNWDDGMAKIESFVRSYPDDKEARGFYAILLHVLRQDTDGALAQLDTALMLDARYNIALTWLVQIHRQREDFDHVIKYALKKKQYYPEAAEPYETLARIYQQQGRYDDAIRMAQDLRERIPDNRSSVSTIINCYMLMREFDKARDLVEEAIEKFGDDPYYMATANYRIGNLALWEGRINEGLDYMHRSLQSSLETGDSNYVRDGYESIALYYETFGDADSVKHYAYLGHTWANGFNTLNYPITMVSIDPANEAEARPLITEALDNFRARLPEEMWPLANLLQASFDALVERDTAKTLEIATELRERFNQNVTIANLRSGRTSIAFGEVEDGLELISRVVEGNDQTTGASFWIEANYWQGRAYEQMNRPEDAAAKYRTVLKYWGEADRKVDFVEDSRERLAKLAAS